jgi:branched-chain amino acid transport system substrate-binding protein
MRLRAVVPLAVSAGLVVSVAACKDNPYSSGGSGGGSSSEIVVGASLELSGPTASIGTAYQKALELKAKQLNDGGTLGNRKIRLVIRDNRTDNSASVTNVNDLIKNQHVHAVVMGGCSACGVAAIPAVTAAKIPAIALGSASALTKPVDQRHYVFKISPNPDQDAAVVTDELKRKGSRSVALIAVNNVYGQDGAKSVTALTKQAGITVADAEQFGQTDTNMTVQVSKIVAARPDAVVIWSVMPAAGIIVKALHDAGFKGAVYLDAGAGAELFVKGAGAAAEGTNMVFPKVLATSDIDASTPAGQAQKAWVSAYSSVSGDYSGFASFAGDALQVIADAVRSSGGTDPAKLRDAIEAEHLDGLSGPLQFSASEHSGLQPAALGILTVRQGKWRLAK